MGINPAQLQDIEQTFSELDCEMPARRPLSVLDNLQNTAHSAIVPSRSDFLLSFRGLRWFRGFDHWTSC